MKEAEAQARIATRMPALSILATSVNNVVGGLAITSGYVYVLTVMPPLDQTDYSVVVKRRAPPPKAWRWEIYRAGRGSALEQSAIFFPTITAASKAGKEALKQLMDKLGAERLLRPL